MYMLTESELNGFACRLTKSPVPSPSFCTKGLISLIWLLRRLSRIRLVRLAREEMSLIWLPQRWSSVRLVRSPSEDMSLIWLESRRNNVRLVRLASADISLILTFFTKGCYSYIEDSMTFMSNI